MLQNKLHYDCVGLVAVVNAQCLSTDVLFRKLFIIMGIIYKITFW